MKIGRSSRRCGGQNGKGGMWCVGQSLVMAALIWNLDFCSTDLSYLLFTLNKMFYTAVCCPIFVCGKNQLEKKSILSRQILHVLPVGIFSLSAFSLMNIKHCIVFCRRVDSLGRSRRSCKFSNVLIVKCNKALFRRNLSKSLLRPAAAGKYCAEAEKLFSTY